MSTAPHPASHEATIHHAPDQNVRDDDTLCCHRSPLDLPCSDGFTTDQALVTCGLSAARVFNIVRLVPAEVIADEPRRRQALRWMRSQLLHEALETHRSWTVLERVHYRISGSPTQAPGLLLVSVAVRRFADRALQ